METARQTIVQKKAAPHHKVRGSNIMILVNIQNRTKKIKNEICHILAVLLVCYTLLDLALPLVFIKSRIKQIIS